MNIILHQPEIPANTGNIGRTCVATNSTLHLIEPLGFKLNEKTLQRAGMDYWDKLKLERHISYEKFREEHPETQWKFVVGTRNYMVHEYFQVDNVVVWDVVTNDLPMLKQQINKYLSEME